MISGYKPLLLLLGYLLVSLVHAEESTLCIQCHAKETAQWQQSQHSVSMQVATAETILGNFVQGHFTDEGLKADFFSEDGVYKIKLTEADDSQIWQVKYAFGIYPLQQYLIDTGDGKLQALNIAWDTRDAEEGGQRWFRLDDPDHQSPGSSLHWRGVYQNWNSMCADCHSTGLIKGYQPDTGRFSTRFDQISVSCSACHSRAQAHAAAAEQGKSLPAGEDLAPKGSWVPGTRDRKPQHVGPESSAAQIETCGRCHSLRTRLSVQPNGRMHDQYALTRLHAPLYFNDGRVRDEVFVLGSFLQSKMHRAGVVCTNCHNPHTAKPILKGNQLCSQCHQSSVFDSADHHQHEEGGPGSQCVDCHMPERTYMQVDPRREHNFTTPNPRAAQRAESPDPCLACHQDADSQWSINQVQRLWPEHVERSEWLDVQQAELPAMVAFLYDGRQADLHRATLLEQQGARLSAAAPNVILQHLQSPKSLLRTSAWKAAATLEPTLLVPYAAFGLGDTSLSVRLSAFETLQGMNALPRDVGDVREEYEAYLDLQADRPSGRTLRARYAMWQGQIDSAERDLRRAIEMDDAYVPAFVLLSDILRGQRRFEEAVILLGNGLEALPGNATLLHLRGLARLQQKQLPEALDDLKAAWSGARDNPDFGYRYGLALYHTGHQQQARIVFSQLQQAFPEYSARAGLSALMRN